MHVDLHGLPISTASADAAAAWNRTLLAMLNFRASALDELTACLAADADCCMAHCLHASLWLQLCDRRVLPQVDGAAARASALAGKATPRERAHVQAMAHWRAGRIDLAITTWETILDTHPTDVLALQLAHGHYFSLGQTPSMRDSLERLAPAWHAGLPAYGTWLACRAFAAEECGDFERAERWGREAVDRDAQDLWAVHAVAHVMHMQGRHEEGLVWLTASQPQWADANNFVHHLGWHAALLHLERREFDAVLALYDTQVRNLASPLTRALPDLYADMENAVSLLARLELLGVPVGERWVELADKAEARTSDCSSALTLPHWALALAAGGRDGALLRLFDAMRAFAGSAASTAAVVGDVALTLCLAIAEHRRGEHVACVERLRPLMPQIVRLGGSHVQRDVFRRLAADAARHAGVTG